MRIGMSTAGVSPHGVAEAFRVAAELGFDGST